MVWTLIYINLSTSCFLYSSRFDRGSPVSQLSNVILACWSRGTLKGLALAKDASLMRSRVHFWWERKIPWGVQSTSRPNKCLTSPRSFIWDARRFLDAAVLLDCCQWEACNPLKPRLLWSCCQMTAKLSISSSASDECCADFEDPGNNLRSCSNYCAIRCTTFPSLLPNWWAASCTTLPPLLPVSDCSKLTLTWAAVL